MKAVGWVLLLAGIVLFMWAVDRSPWVLVAVCLVALAAVILVQEYRDTATIGIADAAELLTAEQKAARR